MRIVIIEDEKLTAEDLVDTIHAIDSQIEIVAVLNSVKEAIHYFQENSKNNIDLVFSDIQLGDGLSFEIFSSIQLKFPVIFCTAYDEYALSAFKSNGIDYILKPFTRKTIEEALSKFRDLKKILSADDATFEKISELFENRKKPVITSVMVYVKEKIVPINLNEIALFYIENDIVRLKTFDQKTFPISNKLEELERLAGNNFYRANRKFLINRKAIVDASQYFHRKLQINLTIPLHSNEPITVSKVKVTQFINWLSEN